MSRADGLWGVRSPAGVAKVLALRGSGGSEARDGRRRIEPLAQYTPLEKISKTIAGKVARNLREFGYPDVTADMVLAQIRLPEGKRDIIGRFAVSILAENGIYIPPVSATEE